MTQNENRSKKVMKQSIKATMEKAERRYIVGILHSVDWRIGKAANLLKIDRSTLFRKMKKYGIKKGD